MNNPLEAFESAYNVSSKGRKPLQGVLDAFDEEQSFERKYRNDTRLERDKAMYKSQYQSPEDEELNQAKTDYYNAMASQKEFIKSLQKKLEIAEKALIRIETVGRHSSVHIGDTGFMSQEATIAQEALSELKNDA